MVGRSFHGEMGRQYLGISGMEIVKMQHLFRYSSNHGRQLFSISVIGLRELHGCIDKP